MTGTGACTAGGGGTLGEFGVAAGIGSALWIMFLVPVEIQAVGGPSGAADMGWALAAWVVAAGVLTAP